MRNHRFQGVCHQANRAASRSRSDHCGSAALGLCGRYRQPSLGRRDGSGVSSLCARSRGEPSSARCEQRLSERLTPCPCDPVCACTGMRGHTKNGTSGRTTQRGATQPLHFLSPTTHAAQRAVPGWRGGLGSVGADLASAGSMRPPPSPARHVSTARLATTNASRETARNHPSQAKNGTPPQKPGKKQQPIRQ